MACRLTAKIVKSRVQWGGCKQVIVSSMGLCIDALLSMASVRCLWSMGFQVTTLLPKREIEMYSSNGI